MKMMIFRSNRKSSSAFALKEALINEGFNAKVNRIGNDPPPNRTVINWGVSSLDSKPEWINNPVKVAVAVSKLWTFSILQGHGVRIPELTTDLAYSYGADRRGKWLARQTLIGHSGQGIVVIRPEDEVIPDAPLYVKYIPKLLEYRLHVMDGKVIAVQQKKKESSAERSNDQALIRNRANGWVYCVDNITPPTEECNQQAIAAVSALGLEFGAVDIVIGRDDNLPYVLEVNTAPGLHSPTVMTAYAKGFKEMLDA